MKDTENSSLLVSIILHCKIEWPILKPCSIFPQFKFCTDCHHPSCLGLYHTYLSCILKYLSDLAILFKKICSIYGNVCKISYMLRLRCIQFPFSEGLQHCTEPHLKDIYLCTVTVWVSESEGMVITKGLPSLKLSQLHFA